MDWWKPGRLQSKAGQIKLDIANWWIVSYNVLLSKTFSCHIVIEEWVSRLSGIKYPFKYVREGRDSATVQHQNETAGQFRLRNFVEGRYFSLEEAAWKILGFWYVDRPPLVGPLDVYLEGRHTAYFHECNEQKESGSKRPGTVITKSFKSNKLHLTPRSRLHSKYAIYFTCNRDGKRWKPSAAFKLYKRTSDEITIGDQQIERQKQPIAQEQQAEHEHQSS